MRKKIFIGSVVVAVFVAIYVIVTPRYVGESIQRFLTQPASLKPFLMEGMTVQNLSIQRHWFSSDLTATIHMEPSANYSFTLPQGLNVDVVAHIQHGPILLGRDVHGRWYLKFGHAFIDLQKKLPPDTLESFKKMGFQFQPTVSTSAITVSFFYHYKGTTMVSPFSIARGPWMNVSIASFMVDWSSRITQSSVHYSFLTKTPLVFSNQQERLTQKSVRGTVDFPLPFNFSKVNLSLKTRDVNFKEGKNNILDASLISISKTPEKSAFSLKDLVARAQGYEVNVPNFSYSKMQREGKPRHLNVTMPSMDIHFPNQTTMNVGHFSIKGKQTQAHDLLKGDTLFNIREIQYNGETLGPITFRLLLDHWYIPALMNYREVVRQLFFASSMATKLQLKPTLSREERFSLIENKIKLIRLQYLAMQMWPHVVDKGARIRIEPFSIQSPKGTVAIQFSWQYPKVGNENAPMSSKELKGASKARLNVLASEELVRSLMVQLLQWQTGGTIQKEQMEKKVGEDLQRAVGLKQLMTTSHGEYQLTLSYEDGHLYLNDHLLSAPLTPPGGAAPATQNVPQVSGKPAAPTTQNAQPVSGKPAAPATQNVPLVSGKPVAPATQNVHQVSGKPAAAPMKKETASPSVSQPLKSNTGTTSSEKKNEVKPTSMAPIVPTSQGTSQKAASSP